MAEIYTESLQLITQSVHVVSQDISTIGDLEKYYYWNYFTVFGVVSSETKHVYNSIYNKSVREPWQC